MLCNVSESQGKPGLAGSEQKPGRKPGVALPSETQEGSNPVSTSALLTWDRVCNLLHQSRKTVDLLSSRAGPIPPCAGSHGLA